MGFSVRNLVCLGLRVKGFSVRNLVCRPTCMIVGVAGLTDFIRAFAHIIVVDFHVIRGYACCMRASRRANSTLL
jgi:hypothetical protein